MKIVKICALCLVAVLAIISPFAIVVGAVTLTPPQYSNTFVGALNEKYDRLNSIDEPKLVVLGGSSVVFGVDSEIIEKYTGMPVVNFGLYAALGTKLMLDLSRSAIGEGDVVVLSPELDPQTMSLYFSADQTFKALDDDYSLFWEIGVDNKLSLLGGMWRFAAEKLKTIRSGRVIDPTGVYNSKSFDERGDLIYPTPENTMIGYYDSNKVVSLTKDMLDTEFIDYLNDYIAYCERRGATVLFAYCPINERALERPYETEEENAQARREFHNYLASKLDCEIIGSIEEAIMDAAYFYDSNFHLNDAGRRSRTIRLTKDILFGLDMPVAVTEEEPKKPLLSDSDTRYFGNDPNVNDFSYELLEDGTYAITRVTYAGQEKSVLTLPLGYNGVKVSTILVGAFREVIAEKVIIPADTNIRVIEDGAFADDSVSALYIYFDRADLIDPPANFLGANSNFKIYVPAGSSYDTDPAWAKVFGIKRMLNFME